MFKYFEENKYSNLYFKIIYNAKFRNSKRGNGFEYHHILPKAKTLFPEFSNLKENSWNGVYLTYKEHFICHKLLIKCFHGIQKKSMIFGLKRLCQSKKHFSSKKYEYSRNLFMEFCNGKNHPMFGMKLSDETKQKMSDSAKGRLKSESHKKKIGDANSKRIWKQESKDKLSESHKNKKLSEIQKEKISESSKGKNNSMFGTKWIHNLELEKSKPVKSNEIENYLKNGWLIGQKKFKRSL